MQALCWILLGEFQEMGEDLTNARPEIMWKLWIMEQRLNQIVGKAAERVCNVIKRILGCEKTR